MKIAIIANASYPIRQPFTGGLEAHTYHLVAKLVEQGHVVTLYAKAGSKTIASSQHILISANTHADQDQSYDLGYQNAMRDIASDNYDLIINNSLNNTPLVTHNSSMAPMITVFHTPPFHELFTVLQNQPLRANRTYIAVSEFTAKQWRKYCANTVHAVSNGIDLASWTTNTQLPTTLKAAWVGRITPEKGTHAAIQACLDAGIPLTLGGPIYDKTYFESTIEPLLSNDQIKYIGHLDQAGINRLFMSASVALITPLWDEPFGLVEVEAWASGTPVAALPNGALPSLVQRDVGSLAINNTPRALGRAIQKACLADRAACRAYAEENFSLAAMVESYLSLVEEDVYDDRTSLQWQIA